MRQFVHRQTGNIAKETHSALNYRVFIPKNFTVPKWIVENSADWDEVYPALLTTEDGVGIFRGDKYFIVWTPECILHERVATAFDRKVTNQMDFSTKEAAEEYILLNKPCISFNDVNKFIGENVGHYSYSDFKRFVKSKL